MIEGMSVEDTAELLRIPPETVKTRLHRALRMMREQIDKQIGPVLMDAFPFAGRRCEQMSNASISGHPVHPMLIPFPIAFFVATLVCDLAYWGTRYDASMSVIAMALARFFQSG
jgi:hypothetical protein